jgi:hypothetical protein
VNWSCLENTINVGPFSALQAPSLISAVWFQSPDVGPGFFLESGKDALPRTLDPRYLILQDATEWG